jgi:hypothetical protein
MDTLAVCGPCTAVASRIPFAITHEPGHMSVTDLTHGETALALLPYVRRDRLAADLDDLLKA